MRPAAATTAPWSASPQPLRDPAGRVIAFGGRALRNDSGDPRYLNTRTTATYRKAEHLYGIAENAAALRAGAIPVVTEGITDAIAVTAAGAGAYAGIALGGTALTPGHARLLRALPRAPLIAFDPDPAGQRAAAGALPLLGPAAAVVILPGLDPAQLAADLGSSALNDALRDTRPLAELAVDQAISHWPLRWAEGRLGAAARIIAALPPDMAAGQASRAAAITGISQHTLTDLILTTLSHKPPGAL